VYGPGKAIFSFPTARVGRLKDTKHATYQGPQPHSKLLSPRKFVPSPCWRKGFPRSRRQCK